MSYLQGTFEERCLTTGAPTVLSFFTATLSAIFLILNIPGNLLLITAVAMDPHKNLRSPFNLLMANLGSADILAGLVVYPLSINYHIKEGLNKSLSQAEISIFHLFFFISCTASVLSLASLAVERYLAACHPTSYRNKVTGRRVLLTVACIWTISLSLPFVYLEVGFITCSFILVNTSAVASITITAFTYTLIVYKFKRHVRERGFARGYTRGRDRAERREHDNTSYRMQRGPTGHPKHTRDFGDRGLTRDRGETRERGGKEDGGGMPNCIPMQKRGPTRDRGLARGDEHARDCDVMGGATSKAPEILTKDAIQDKFVLWERKITKMFLVVMMALLCCYGPATTLIYVMSFCETCSCATLHWFRDLHFLLVLMNSNVNFFCYTLRSPRYRRAFAYILRRNNRDHVTYR